MISTAFKEKKMRTRIPDYTMQNCRILARARMEQMDPNDREEYIIETLSTQYHESYDEMISEYLWIYEDGVRVNEVMNRVTPEDDGLTFEQGKYVDES